MDKLPVISKELLDALEKRFPNQCPNIKDSDREIWVKVGARSVVNFLRFEFDKQNENIMR